MVEFQKRLSHPTPQFMRDGWMDLNGSWEFEFDQQDCGLAQGWYREHCFGRVIQVPFAWQSALSGIEAGEECSAQVVWYRRVLCHTPVAGQRLLLHFDACDYHTILWVNGQRVGEHRGGFSPFTVDVTAELWQGENTLVVRVEDATAPTQLLGKQSWKGENFLCWYTPTTGIWQSAWAEIVPVQYMTHARIEPDLDTATVSITVFMNTSRAVGAVELEVHYHNRMVNSAIVPVRDGIATAVLEVGSDDCDFLVDPWSPESPSLYDLFLTYRAEGGELDRVTGYFGMRKIAVSGNRVLLNNKEFYQKLVLNQGYYGKGGMTPQSPQMLLEDVEKIKRCGFNGMRIHQKVEFSTLLFLCDYYGLVVWSEIPSFYRDDPRARAEFWEQLPQIVEKQRNHPSIITWVLFNESWGLQGIHNNRSQQQLVDAAYAYLHSCEPSRLIIGNDGWEHTQTDLLTIHDYAQSAKVLGARFNAPADNLNGSFSQTSQRNNFAEGYRYSGQPVLISELGGIAWGGGEDSWGYGKRPTSPKGVLERLRELIEAVLQLDGVCGFCYTQWSDVEQEVNGLLDAEHREKFSPEQIAEILNGTHHYGYIFE